VLEGAFRSKKGDGQRPEKGGETYRTKKRVHRTVSRTYQGESFFQLFPRERVFRDRECRFMKANGNPKKPEKPSQTPP